jgi:hypothetical protein
VDQWTGDGQALERQGGHNCVACLNYQADTLKQFVASEAADCPADKWQLRRIVDDEHPDATDVSYGSLGYGRPACVPLTLTDPHYGQGSVLEDVAGWPCGDDDFVMGFVVAGRLGTFPVVDNFNTGAVNDPPEVLDATVAMAVVRGHEATPVVVMQGSSDRPRVTDPGVCEAMGRLYEPAIALERLLGANEFEMDGRALASGAGVFWANVWTLGAVADVMAVRRADDSAPGEVRDPQAGINNCVDSATKVQGDRFTIDRSLLSSWPATQSLAIDTARIENFATCILRLNHQVVQWLSPGLFARLALTRMPCIHQSLELLASFNHELARDIEAAVKERGWMDDSQPEAVGLTRLAFFGAGQPCTSDFCEQGAAK